MKNVQQSQTFFALAGLTETKIKVSNHGSHDGGYRLSLLRAGFLPQVLRALAYKGSFHGSYDSSSSQNDPRECRSYQMVIKW